MPGSIAKALTDLGCSLHAAEQIAASAVNNYLTGALADADDLADLPVEARGVAGEITVALTTLARAAGGPSCPDVGPAAAHAAAAVRMALDHAPADRQTDEEDAQVSDLLDLADRVGVLVGGGISDHDRARVFAGVHHGEV